MSRKPDAPFELVWKRGGDTPVERRTWWNTEDECHAQADRERRNDQKAGWTKVWLAYEIWAVKPNGNRRRIATRTLQR